jgi:hypothetical protein
LFFCEARLKRLAQDLKDMAPELRQCIQEENAVVRQGHLSWHGPLAADHADIGDRMVGDTE